jgi:hypothetical protein
MDHRWLKQNTKEEVLGYRNALDALKEILLKDFVKKESVRDYSPGWEFKQIATNEYNHVLEDIIKLITIEKE